MQPLAIHSWAANMVSGAAVPPWGRGGRELILLQDGLHQHGSGFSLLHSRAAQGVLGQLEESQGDGLGECRGEVADKKLRGQVSDLSRQERWGELGHKTEGKRLGQRTGGKPTVWGARCPSPLSPVGPRQAAFSPLRLTSLVLSCKQLSRANKLVWEKKSQQPLCRA